MLQTIKKPYTELSEEQIRKLPWNRLKNIMKSVRAVISDIERNHGLEWCCELHCEVRIDPQYRDRQHRDNVVQTIVAPMKQYFEMLKSYAAKLPDYHKVKK